MTTAIALVAVLALGALVQTLCTARDRRRFPPPGRVIDGLHVHEVGTAGPPVVFEAGIAASCLGWAAVQTALASDARTWSYDRRGLGWSAPMPSLDRPSLHAITDELRSLVNVIDVPRPFVLVAHSFGAYVATLYANRFPLDVSGLVLVDPLTPAEWLRPAVTGARRLHRAVVFTRLTAVLAAFGLVRLGLWGLLRRGGGNPGHSAWIEPHPPAHGRRGREAAPPNLSRALRALWSEPGFFKTLAVNHAVLPLCAAELGGRQIPPGIPVTVLSGAHQPPERLAEHAAMATRHVVVDGCAHWIHLDHPDIVSAAIRQVGHR